MSGDVSRRRVLGWVAAGAVGAAGGAEVERAVTSPEAAAVPASASPDPTDPDSGRLARVDQVARSRAGLQPGIRSAVPAFGHVLAIDLAGDVRADPSRARAAARELLRRWTDLQREAAAGSLTGPADAAALDIRPASLEITIGLGASLLETCGLGAHRPPGLADLPVFATDALQPALSGGDLVVQLGAEDPMKLAGALQTVAGTLGDLARVRWSRSGFRQTSAAGTAERQTPRNLMGHRDGTDNPAPGSALFVPTVTSLEPAAAYAWMRGGSYLVARRIRMQLDTWFAQTSTAQERVIGRRVVDGSPLTGHRERAPVELDATDGHGEPVIPRHAHIRLASARYTSGARIYRRSWNYDDGWGRDGARDAGLIFLAWQADPRTGFVAIQRSLTEGQDALHAFIRHVGSALFAVPPRAAEGEHVGQALFEAWPTRTHDRRLRT